jgi:hypothetical protein
MRIARLARPALIGSVVLGAALPFATALAVPEAAHADSTQGTDHFVVTETDYFPKAGDDPTTFWGIFSLDGACGFASSSITVDDTETFFVAQHNNGATGFKYNSVGHIQNEAWTLTPRTADGTVLPTFSGTADEVATATGTGGGANATSVNFGFHGKASNAAGRTLDLVIKGVLRTDKDGNVSRFDWGVQSCNVH